MVSRLILNLRQPPDGVVVIQSGLGTPGVELAPGQ